MPLPRVRYRALVAQELKGLPRNTFALGAIAVVFALVAVPVSGLMVGQAGLSETLIFTWFILPLVVAILVAARIAGARRTRFVDSLYTTPLSQPTWFAAQATVGAVLGLLALLVQVPFLVVTLAWLGVPDILPQAALAAFGVAAFAVALGLLCGVLVGDASPMAAAGLAGGLGFLAFVLFLVHGILMQEPATAGRDAILHLTALSPLSLASNASGIGIGGLAPASPWRPIAGLLGLTGGLVGAAWLAYTRAQTPLGWDARGTGARLGGPRLVVAAVVALALAAPVATAETTFVPDGAEPLSYEPGAHTWVAFVERGAPITEASFDFASIVDAPRLRPHTDVAYDVLVLAMPPEGKAARDVAVQVRGTPVVRVIEGGLLRDPSGEPDARVLGPDARPGDAPQPVYRVPVTLRATSFSELGTSPSPIEVVTTFKADAKTYASGSRAILYGDVPWGFSQLLAAGLVLPATAAVAFARRKWSTR